MLILETLCGADHPVCAFKGGFAAFSGWRSHPSSLRRGTPSSERRGILRF
jgi:hypothetical protein